MVYNMPEKEAKAEFERSAYYSSMLNALKSMDEMQAVVARSEGKKYIYDQASYNVGEWTNYDSARKAVMRMYREMWEEWKQYENYREWYIQTYDDDPDVIDEFWFGHYGDAPAVYIYDGKFGRVFLRARSVD